MDARVDIALSFDEEFLAAVAHFEFGPCGIMGKPAAIFRHSCFVLRLKVQFLLVNTRLGSGHVIVLLMKRNKCASAQFHFDTFWKYVRDNWRFLRDMLTFWVFRAVCLS